MAGIILYSRQAKRWEAWKDGTVLKDHDSDLSRLAFRNPTFRMVFAAVVKS